MSKEPTIVEIRVEGLHSLIDEALAARNCWNRAVWFRGQASNAKDWGLAPSVFRADFKALCEVDRTHDIEMTMILKFMQKAPARYHNCPRNEDYAHWLSLMQHYRLPTRLLDWTGSVLVAGFFAVTEPACHSVDGVVWMLDPGKLNEEMAVPRGLLLPLDRETANEQFHVSLRKHHDEKKKRILAVVPDEVDSRLLVQQSAFTLHGMDTPLDRVRGSDRFLRRLVIPAEKKAEIEDGLRFMGIRRENLFPDLGNLADDINYSLRRMASRPASEESRGKPEVGDGGRTCGTTVYRPKR